MSGDARASGWDLPARVCHWGFATSVTGSLWIGFRSDPRGDLFKYHMPLGALALWFIAARVALGFFGGPLSRWRAFAHPPRTILRYLADVARWRSQEPPGVNPGTALFAPAIHLGVIMLFVTGFFAEWSETWHGRIAWMAVALIACHLAGLFLHAARHRAPTFLAMIHGRRHGERAAGSRPPMLRQAGTVLLAASLLLAWLAFRGFDAESSVLRLPGLPEIEFRLIQRG